MLIVLLVLWLMLVLLLPSHILLYNNNIFLSQFLQVKPNFYFEGLPWRPLKGQFTQEWKLSFTHAWVVPKLCFFHLLNTKEDIFMNVGKQTSSHWLPQYLFFSNYGSQWLPSTTWLPSFFKVSSFVLNRSVQTCFCFVHPNFYITVMSSFLALQL